MLEDRIEKDIRIDAPIERVWTVLTDREHMGEWLEPGFTLRELNLRPGGLLLLDHKNPPFTLPARIVTVTPPTLFSFRWAMAYREEPTEENSTLVEFRLTRDGNGTLLQVTESGYARLVIPAGREHAGPEAHSRGWPIFLAEIRTRVAEFSKP